MEDSPSVPATNGNRSAVTQASEQILASDLIINIRYATALGWAMTELLGRCIMLVSWLKKRDENPPPPPDCKSHPVILSPIRDQRERVLTVMGRILFLAKKLGIAECRIEQNNNNERLRAYYGDPYVTVLEERVRALCSSTHDREDIRADINDLLLSWSEEIQFLLQMQPPAVYNAYTVARGFATIRWWIGVGAAMDQANSNENALLSEATLNKLLDHLQSISSYLPPLVPQALEYSLIRWGKTILKYPGVWQERNEDNKKNDEQSRQSESRDKQEKIKLNMKRALIKQSTIWHDLLTDERDPTTFISPDAINRRYFRKILLHSIPYLLVGLFVAVGAAFLLVYLQRLLSIPVTGAPNKTTESVTDTIIITIISIVSTIPFVRTIWIWGSKTTTDFIGKYEDTLVSRISTAEKDALKLLWQRAQQEAVNAKTFVSPRSSQPDIDDGD